MFIEGKKVESKATEFFDVHNPATGEVIARTPLCTAAEMEEAADSCAEAFKKWRSVPPSQRARVMHKFEDAVRQSMPELSKILTSEIGKTSADAQGDVFRGLEVVEIATSIPSMLQ